MDFDPATLAAWLRGEDQPQAPGATPALGTAPALDSTGGPTDAATPLGRALAQGLLDQVSKPGDALLGKAQVFGPDGHVTDEAADWGAGMGLGMVGGSSIPRTPGLAAGDAVLTAGAARRAGPGQLDMFTPPAPEPIRAYHGSPHDFDRFDLSKIGTGEGAQVYGHGLYFAEAEPTAAYYRQQLSGPGVELYRDGTKVGPVPQDARSLTDLASQAIPGEAPGWVKSSVLRAYRDAADAGQPLTPEVLREGALRHALGPNPPGPNAVARVTSDIDGILQSGLPGLEFRRPGHMYEVGINADPDKFLPWDKPLGPQHADALRFAGLDADRFNVRNPNGGSMYRPGMGVSEAEAKRALRDFQSGYDRYRKPGEDGKFELYHEPPTGQTVYQELSLNNAQGLPPVNSAQRGVWRGRSDAAASQLLRDEAGIPGIKYLDQGSRDGGYGTHNFVVFDDKIVEIMRKYGVASFAALPPAIQMMLQGSGSAPSGDLHYPAQ